MSSSSVRTALINFLEANAPTETFVDLSGRFEDLQQMLDEESLTVNDKWVGVQFIGNDEIPITIGSNNTKGKYREEGVIYIHVVDVAKMGVWGVILTRAEALRSLLRGQKIGTMLIESVTPVNSEAGAALRFEDGLTSGSFILSYQNDLDM